VPTPQPYRKQHPGIAPLAAGVSAQGAPLLAIPDGLWNHDEGFGSTPADHGQIWFGTIARPDPRPAAYGTASASLSPDELGTGSVHKITWTPGQGFTQLTSRILHPTTQQARGASAVVGMVLADLLPTATGDELVVGTLSGDLIVYSADTLSELWRTHVDGAAGCYNSLHIADLDNDTFKELYVAGSSGLWRLIRPGEELQ
jgi:hypothetical protein